MDAPEPVLFARYPRLRDQLVWLPIGRFPTPVEPLRLQASAADVWIKRDDLSGEPYGGNKVRKLEFILAEANRRHAGRLITGGAAGSHHALATTVYGRQLGFEVSLLLFPQPLTPHVRDVVLQDAAHGATLHWVPRMELIPLAMHLARLRYRRERPLVIAPGGSDRFGTLGYVNGALELASQIEQGEMPMPSAVHVAAGTLGTAAGLALGFALAGLPVRIVATRVIGRLVANSWALRGRIAAAARLLARAGVETPPVRDILARVALSGDYLGPGYGHQTPDGRAAMLQLRPAGVQLDPTYTGKAAAALLEATRAAGAGPVLFWHTLSAREATPATELPAVEELPRSFRRWLSRPDP